MIDETSELGIHTASQAYCHPAFESENLLDQKILAFLTSRNRPITSVRMNRVTSNECYTTFHPAIRPLGDWEVVLLTALLPASQACGTGVIAC